MRRPTTPSQTIGPYLSLGTAWLDGGDVVGADEPGAIRIAGRLFDGAGEPVGDGLIETWQASPGRSGGFGRSLTDEQGRWRVRTLKPGLIPGSGGVAQAPHLEISIFARGLLDRVVTRIYFADEEEANATDPLLARLDDRVRATLVAAPTDDGYAIDFRLQGEDETAFLAI